MPQSQRLSGEEVEQWFRDFAKNTSTLDTRQHSLEPLIRLFDQKLQWRLTQASLNAYAKFPEGPEWVSRIQQGQSLPIIPEQTQQAFSEFLLDRVLAVDVPLKMQDHEGNTVAIAVDVTANFNQEQHKLRKIRGQSENEEGQNINNNRKMPEVRAELGYDRHIVVVLSNELEQLPSYDKLLSELQAFTNTPSRTDVLNLQNVPEHDRFINQKRPESPGQILGRYNQELNLKDPAKRISGIATRTYQDGLERETAIKVLLEDPFFQGMKSRPAQAQKLATQAIERIWSEQKQAQSAPAPEAKPKLADWPIYASAIGQGRVIQERVKQVVAAHQQSGKSLNINDSIAIKKAFKAYQEELTTLHNWYEVAQQLDATPSYLREISKTEQALRQGNPLTKETREQMNRDINQLAYNRLSAEISEEEPRKFLVRLAANAAKQGIGASQLRGILSLSPEVQSVQAKRGKQASQNFVRDVMVDGLKLNKREQPPPPRQNRGPDIDRGPSRGR